LTATLAILCRASELVQQASTLLQVHWTAVETAAAIAPQGSGYHNGRPYNQLSWHYLALDCLARVLSLMSIGQHQFQHGSKHLLSSLQGTNKLWLFPAEATR
jgi:hypothetical protein